MNGPNIICAACRAVTNNPLSPLCEACAAQFTFVVRTSATTNTPPEMIDRAYRALTPTVPEPIRALVLELAGRIA